MRVSPDLPRSMTRDAAIAALAEIQIRDLSVDDRNLLLAEWWDQEMTDPRYGRLPTELRAEMKNNPSYEDALLARYDPLLLIALSHQFYGVVNSFILRELNRNGIGADRIIGEPERMSQCPCCCYYSLPARMDYDICPVCWWEDDGTEDPEKISGPNHMTLGTARVNFLEIGVCDPKMMSRRDASALDKFESAATGNKKIESTDWRS